MPLPKDPPIVAKLVLSSFNGKAAELTSEECSQLVALIMHSRVAARKPSPHNVAQLNEALVPFVVKDPN